MRALACPALLLCLLLGSTAAQAACESGLAERMQARLYPNRSLDHGLAACKAWPAFAGRSIVVLPLQPLEEPAMPTGQRSLDLAVLLIQRPDNGNTERDAVIAQSYQSAALVESGAALQELRIDTSRFLLATGQRAFGLRARYRGDELAAPFASESLRLYLPQGKKILEVLAETEMDRDSGRWDLQCDGQFERLRSQLSVDAEPGQRWADLVIARTLTPSRARLQPDGQCLEHTGPSRHTPLRLRHDGQGYATPAPAKSAALKSPR
ncbi:hypothetical protein PGB34_14530 [Xenophilus arseniciresistens]|uniref:Lipoprotein n=1 Tax=Xenophilus arseniciresistens TaxID=1283306 RepID=A0AAE3T0G3_9BURK|nr:hypothetical protein [Xenophilus arseniciresistens]MDA7417575.1 hypothetical protein [Xenophilus arseniciresistens]